jgi:hypothetical protein
MKNHLFFLALGCLTSCGSIGIDFFRRATIDKASPQEEASVSPYAYHVVESYAGAQPQPFYINVVSISFDEREYWVEGRKLCSCSGPHSLRVTVYDDVSLDTMRSFGEYVFRDARHKKGWSVPVPTSVSPSTILRLYGECIKP